MLPVRLNGSSLSVSFDMILLRFTQLTDNRQNNHCQKNFCDIFQMVFINKISAATDITKQYIEINRQMVIKILLWL